jgi:hypothetical protein
VSSFKKLKLVSINTHPSPNKATKHNDPIEMQIFKNRIICDPLSKNDIEKLNQKSKSS